MENASTMYMETSSNTPQGKERCPVISFMWLKRLLKVTCILSFFFFLFFSLLCSHGKLVVKNWSVPIKNKDYGLHDIILVILFCWGGYVFLFLFTLSYYTLSMNILLYRTLLKEYHTECVFVFHCAA